MQVEHRKNLDKNYLIIKSEEYVEKEYQLEMICQNQISGLLPCHYHEINGDIEIFYDITSRQPLSRVFEKKKLKEKDYVTIFHSALEVLEKIKEYLLEENFINFDLEKIYVDIETMIPLFCYIPLKEAEKKNGLFELSEQLLVVIDHAEKSCMELGYEIYNRLLIFPQGYQEIKRIMLKKGEDNASKCEKNQNTLIETWNKNVDSPTNVNKNPENEVLNIEKFKLENENAEKNKIEKIKSENHKKKITFREIQNIILPGSIILIMVIVLKILIECQLINTGSLKKIYLDGMLGIVGIICVLWMIVNVIQKKKENMTGQMEEVEQIENTIVPFIEQETSKPENINTYAEQNIVNEPEKIQNWEEEICGKTRYLGEKTGGLFLIGTGEQKEKIQIEKFPSVIGKKKGVADIVIPDITISRIHAEIKNSIEFGKNQYWIKDLNSTNGTFINNRMLMAEEISPIHHGDIVRFAEMEYLVFMG